MSSIFMWLMTWATVVSAYDRCDWNKMCFDFAAAAGRGDFQFSDGSNLLPVNPDKKTKNTQENALKTVKDLMKQVLFKGKNLNKLSPSDQAVFDAIDKIEMRSNTKSPCAEFCRIGQLAGAMPRKYGTHMCICPRVLSLPYEQILFAVAHEATHLVDPCDLAAMGFDYNLHPLEANRISSCINPGLELDRRTRWVCKSKSATVDMEARADWVGYQVLGLYLKDHPLGHGRFDYLRPFSVFLTIGCEREQGAGYGQGHPAARARIESIGMKINSVREALGCEKIDEPCTIPEKRHEVKATESGTALSPATN